jgi:hypothetical protein
MPECQLTRFTDTIGISERDPALVTFGQPVEKKEHDKLESAH